MKWTLLPRFNFLYIPFLFGPAVCSNRGVSSSDKGPWRWSFFRIYMQTGWDWSSGHCHGCAYILWKGCPPCGLHNSSGTFSKGMDYGLKASKFGGNIWSKMNKRLFVVELKLCLDMNFAWKKMKMHVWVETIISCEIFCNSLFSISNIEFQYVQILKF